ncbi:hypothetical protein HETIRDRAFT_242619, partial [Heterobasidion irregulare TC 32-1]
TESKCVFCNITSKNGFNIVCEDEKYVVIRDRRPAASHHVLVIPRRHVESVKDLSKSDVTMVKDMEKIGHEQLDKLQVSPTMRRLGFHIPPFNSVNHLHLHVMALPFKSLIRKAKYPWIKGGDGHEKGWTWFAEIGQTIRILEKGGRVTV